MSSFVADALASGKQALKQLIGERSFNTVRAYRHFWLSRWRGKQPLFVHQMGKVGSTTLVKSLKASSLGRQLVIYQTHFLSPEGMAFVERLEEDGYGGRDRMPDRTKRFLANCRVWSRHLATGAFNTQRLRVISMVRDPVATNLSGYFYNAHWWPQALQEDCRQRAPGHLEQLRAHFLAHYPHHVPLTWFDMEMKTVFGIDVFATPFDAEQGYQIYRGERADLLVLKLEKLEQAAAPALAEFLGLDHLTLLRVNEGADKWYAPLYKEFTRVVQLPDSYLDEIYTSPAIRYFYDAGEIKAFRERWSKAIRQPAL